MNASDQSRIRPDKRAEVFRRAEIVKRYLKIERPTEADDLRFAAEIGLSTDSLYRLAAAWRLHGDAGALQGASIKISQEDVSAALEAARADLDLTGVAPARRAETLRRVDVIRRYLEVDNPTRADRLASAAAMGVPLERFVRILRGWILHRSCNTIPGATVPRRRRRKNPAKRDRVQELLVQAIARAGDDAPGTRVREYLEQSCLDEGLKPPSRATLYEWVRRVRERAAG